MDLQVPETDASSAGASTVETTTTTLPAGAAPVGDHGGDGLFIAFVVVVAAGVVLFGALKFVLIARLFGFKLGGGEKRIEEPRRPRDPGLDGPQVAGMSCAACKRNILSDVDGMTCADCERAIHKKCHSRHVTKSHAPAPGAYR